MLEELNHGFERHRKHVCRRLKWGKDIVNNLNNIPLVNGLLRVDLKPCALLKEYNLHAWVEGEQAYSTSKASIVRKTNEKHTKLFKIWIDSGKSSESFYRKAKNFNNIFLNDYELDMVNSLLSQSDSELIMSFLKKSKGLLGESRFQEVLSEFKYYCLTKQGNKIRSKKALMISFIEKAVHNCSR